MSKLTDDERALIKLIVRSRDVGDGWRKVSVPLWEHVARHAHPDLMEYEADTSGGGRIRLNERGRIVAEYLF